MTALPGELVPIEHVGKKAKRGTEIGPQKPVCETRHNKEQAGPMNTFLPRRDPTVGENLTKEPWKGRKVSYQ